MAILVLTAVLILVLAGALMFSRGGAKETATAVGPPLGSLSRIDARDLGDLTERLIARMGLRIERREPDDGRGPGYVAVMADPLGGSQVYVRAFKLPSAQRLQSQDVQAAIMTARDEGMARTILIAPNGFSDEAILAAEDSATELIDGPKLELLLREGGVERT